ncbi:hypothetical protein [Kribbella antiqua]|nr:hypothetical protein [Kribbella antiqua]
MAWQLWVVLALIAVVLTAFAVWRMRHAQHVFDDIAHLDRAPEPSSDDLARARARREEEPEQPRRSHG